MSVTFDTSKLVDVAKAIGAARLEAVCIDLVNTIRQNVSVPGRTKTQVTISRGKNAGKTRTKWGALNSAPSAPGDFPAKQTGWLRSSMAYEIDRENLTAKVGTAVNYGRYLEMGTSRMAARPWLLRSAAEQHGRRAQILAGK